jgi:8-oxo-dGTP pyrophosphatase MutT (NUDIX family)
MKQYAAVLLETPDGKLIFHKRDNKPGIANPGMIGFFGGGVEEGETFLQAAVREIKEELDLNLDPTQLRAFSNFQKTIELDGEELEGQVFLAQNIDPNQLRPNPNEGQGFIVISKDDNWQEMNLTRMVRSVITKYFENKHE